MASRALRCVRYLSVGQRPGRSYILAPFRRTAFQYCLWGRPLQALAGYRAQWARGSRYNGGHTYCYSTSSSDGGGEEGEEGEESEESGELEEEGTDGQRGMHQTYALAPVSIPDVFPEVPVLPISRNPIFPKFVKMLEVRVHIGG